MKNKDPLVGFHKEVTLISDFNDIHNSTICGSVILFYFKIADQEFCVEANITSIKRMGEIPDHKINLSGIFVYSKKTYNFLMLINFVDKKGTAEIKKTS